MLSITVVDKHSPILKSHLCAYVVQEGDVCKKEIQALDKKEFCGIAALAKQQNFVGRAGTVLIMPAVENEQVQYVALVGLGSPKDSHIDIEQYRRAIGRIVRIAEQYEVDTISFELPAASIFKSTLGYLMQQAVIVAHMAAYKYDRFFTDKKKKKKDISFEAVVPSAHKTSLKKDAARAEIVACAVNEAREWVDTPPELLAPSELAGKARSIAKEYGLKVQVFDEEKIKKLGMGGLEAVSRGSDKDCQLIVLEYNCDKKTAPTIAFVGKGITFDSGGLSIKPAQSMETMKEDMSGAAAVIATMQALAQLKPKVNVIGITPLSENLPSGKATKPGDVVTFYNGKTAEVRNTDAEGRLILADALAYAVKHYKLDAIIDIATLTGACAYAIGPFFTGLMSQHDELAQQVQIAAQTSGDRVWPLPLHDDYKVAIKSSIADLCNIGSKQYSAGAITAGLFLQNFVDGVPWVHLDIAGTAFDVPDISYYRTGATGVGVRLLIDIALNWK